MKKVFILLGALFFLNGCAESVALLGGSVGGASSGKILQSSLTSSIYLLRLEQSSSVTFFSGFLWRIFT